MQVLMSPPRPSKVVAASWPIFCPLIAVATVFVLIKGGGAPIPAPVLEGSKVGKEAAWGADRGSATGSFGTTTKCPLPWGFPLTN